MKILICFGTRPEYIKIKPLFYTFPSTQYDVCFVEQHKDIVIEETVKYSIPLQSYGNNRLNSIIASILVSQIPWANYTHILIQGDTASAFGVALCAFHNNCKIIHLEAGLRSYNKGHPYPEESYRSMISRITDIHLCPGPQSVEHLRNERVEGKIWNVGNTVIDILKKTLQENEIEIQSSEVSDLIVITLHRRENWSSILDTFREFETLAKKYSDLRFVFIKHPNPELHILAEQYMPSVQCIPPQTYVECIKLLAKSRLVITDSGGIQEEASAMGKKILVLREATERSELLQDHVILCRDTLLETFGKVNVNPFVIPSLIYGQGDSAQKICDILFNDV